MDRRDGLITHPVPESKNNLGRQSQQYGTRNRQAPTNGYREALISAQLEEQLRYLREGKSKMEELNQRLIELDKKMNQYARSKIVTAPLKEDTDTIANLRRQNIRVISNNVANSRMVAQTYTRNMSQIPVKPQIKVQVNLQAKPQIKQQPNPQYTQNALIPKEEKVSLWQKIKNSVKSFFGDEPEDKKSTQESYISSTTYNNKGYSGNNNPKYNQFRQSIQKTTVQIDTKNKSDTTKKTHEHILDRYA